MNNEFVREPKQIKAVKSCMPLFKRRTRGETVPFEEIEEATGFTRHSSDWLLLMLHVKRDLLEETGIQIEATYSGSYWLLPAAEQVKGFADRQLRRAKRRISRAEKAVSHVKDELLSDHERNVKHAMMEKLGGAYSVMSQRKAIASAILPKVES